MAAEEAKALGKVLENQKNLIQKLQAELDEERKAAASGAEEALSMILRLQQEKSMQEMESLQYKRIVEEKLRHDEEALVMMREIIFLKDTEIEAVRYQLEVFRSKLLSLCVEGGSFPWFNGYKSGIRGHQNLGRKNVSLPSIRLEELCSEIDDLKHRNAGSIFDDCEKKFTNQNKERKCDNLFRSKSSIKEISSVSNEFRSEAYNSEDDFSPFKLNHANIPFLAPQKKWPRRTSSVVLLDSCMETASDSNSLDKFEIPESLKVATQYNFEFGNEKRGEKSTKEPDLENFNMSMGCVENEMRKMRESNSVASNKQLKLLLEIRDKINALESHIQQRDDQIKEESSNRQRQLRASCMTQLQQPSTNQMEESIMSYYIEAMLSWYM